MIRKMEQPCSPCCLDAAFGDWESVSLTVATATQGRMGHWRTWAKWPAEMAPGKATKALETIFGRIEVTGRLVHLPDGNSSSLQNRLSRIEHSPDRPLRQRL